MYVHVWTDLINMVTCEEHLDMNCTPVIEEGYEAEKFHCCDAYLKKKKVLSCAFLVCIHYVFGHSNIRLITYLRRKWMDTKGEGTAHVVDNCLLKVMLKMVV